MTDKQLFTIREASEILGITYSKVRRLVYAKTIPGIRLGRVWYVPNCWLAGAVRGVPIHTTPS